MFTRVKRFCIELHLSCETSLVTRQEITRPTAKLDTSSGLSKSVETHVETAGKLVEPD